MNAYFTLTVAALLPAVFAAVFRILDKNTGFGKCRNAVKQLIYGISFGALAVIGTEWGIPMNGAQINCRDAAVLTAGLMFGAPAGVIAGIIGGVERWFAVLWGVGSYTRVACSVSTVIAGVYAALLRKLMFEDKRPGWLISFAIGIVMEVFHLTMIFLTNMDDPDKAMATVRLCTAPLLIANGAAVLCAAITLTLLGRRSREEKKEGYLERRTHISQTIQRWLLITVVLAFLTTSAFVFSLQTRMADTQADTLLDIALDETVQDVDDALDAHLIDLAYKAGEAIRDGEDLQKTAEKYGLSEINIADAEGRITRSTEEQYIGFDFSSGSQSSEFVCLLKEAEEYVQPFGPTTYDRNIFRKYAGVRAESGFIQVGYDTEQFKKDLVSQLNGITRNRHVGQNGFILIADENGQTLSAPAYLSPEETAYTPGSEIYTQNAAFTAMIGGKEYRCMYRAAEGCYIVAAIPEEEVLKSRNTALYVNTFMEILVFAVMFGLIYLLIKKVVVDQLKKINFSLAKITGGNLDETVNVRTNAEFSSLSDDINQTVDTLKHYIDEAEDRINQELEFAKVIQTSALPGVFPAFPKRSDFDIYACMDPAREVGGDFYDFYMTGTDTLHFLIADVSGKGIPAAMFMMRAKTELKSLTETDIPIGDVFTGGNHALCEGNEAGMFVTAWQGSLNLITGEMHYINAGHNPPLVKRASGTFEYLRGCSGLVLAGFDGVRYRTQEIQLQPGDTVFLYTDGVTEATDSENRLYGEERLLNTLNHCKAENMKELCRCVRADVDAFVGDAPQFDDITMLAFRYKP